MNAWHERAIAMKWNIVADSSCDLFPTSYQDGEVELSSVPFIITVGDHDFVDTEDLDIMSMVEAMEQEKSASYTACPSPSHWLAEFNKAEHSIAITISSRLSGSMNSALTAKKISLEERPDSKVAILDSRATGPTLVLCVEEIGRLIREGLDFNEVVSRANAFLDKTKCIFALSSFDNLIKNGRMGRLTGFVAKALHMWGIGSASEEGEIVIEGKAKGSKRLVKAFIALMQERGYTGGKIAISHCDNHGMAQTLKESILEHWETAEVKVLPTRGLCSYYAERGGLIVSY